MKLKKNLDSMTRGFLLKVITDCQMYRDHERRRRGTIALGYSDVAVSAIQHFCEPLPDSAWNDFDAVFDEFKLLLLENPS
jgi:hypothetical protein